MQEGLSWQSFHLRQQFSRGVRVQQNSSRLTKDSDPRPPPSRFELVNPLINLTGKRISNAKNVHPSRRGLFCTFASTPKAVSGVCLLLTRVP